MPDSEEGTKEPSTHWLVPYLRLVRAPAGFSALGDPLAGMLIAQGSLSPLRAARVAGAAASLYLAGMAMNDVADRALDAKERPERPIPSGAVSAERAAQVGGGLMAVGVRAAAGAGAGVAGMGVAGAVLAYDFALKTTPAGPITMGACRSLSLLMGAQAAGGARGVARAAFAAVLLGGYVAGLTVLARDETESGGGKNALPGAVLAGAAVGAIALRGGRRSLPWIAVAAALAGPAVVRALRRPSPATTGSAVGAMIRAIPALDAALAAPRAPRAAAAIAVPLLALVRWGRRLIPIS
jgi:4-hydroxybenzoate polyprenyltransferase